MWKTQAESNRRIPFCGYHSPKFHDIQKASLNGMMQSVGKFFPCVFERLSAASSIFRGVG
jgi:hypothetical protein